MKRKSFDVMISRSRTAPGSRHSATTKASLIDPIVYSESSTFMLRMHPESSLNKSERRIASRRSAAPGSSES
jgi:hypothetical protein